MQVYKLFKMQAFWALKNFRTFALKIQLIMIQRIQTLYMLLAGLTSVGLIFILAIWMAGGQNTMAYDNPVYLFLFGLGGGMALTNVFNFKKRKLQVVLNRLIILINFVLFGLMIYEFFQLEAGDKQFGLGIGIPILVIVLLVLANRGVIKDEQLIRSADRIR